MAVKMLDLTKQPERCIFNSSPPEEIAYAESFWHSVRLQPTMESRLVSSDIKQRLGVKKKSSSINSGQHSNEGAGNQLRDFFVRARALDQIANFQRLRRLADARLRDRNMLHMRRQERLQKEAISRDCIKSNPKQKDNMDTAEKEQQIGKAYTIEEMIRQIDEFERMKEKEQIAVEKGNASEDE